MSRARARLPGWQIWDWTAQGRGHVTRWACPPRGRAQRAEETPPDLSALGPPDVTLYPAGDKPQVTARSSLAAKPGATWLRVRCTGPVCRRHGGAPILTRAPSSWKWPLGPLGALVLFPGFAGWDLLVLTVLCFPQTLFRVPSRGPLLQAGSPTAVWRSQASVRPRSQSRPQGHVLSAQLCAQPSCWWTEAPGHQDWPHGWPLPQCPRQPLAWTLGLCLTLPVPDSWTCGGC